MYVQYTYPSTSYQINDFLQVVFLFPKKSQCCLPGPREIVLGANPDLQGLSPMEARGISGDPGN